MTPAAIGILGGTFDPIHYGHLRLALEVAQSLELREVRFIPAATPPHRAKPRTAAEHRVAMVRLAIADNPLFVLDDRETLRSGPSYTFDTLCELRAELGGDCPLVLILGSDAFRAFHTWHRWRDIFSLAHLALAYRPGAALGDLPDSELAAEFVARRISERDSLENSACGAIAVVQITQLDISATALRAALAAGRSVRYLTPDPVIRYSEGKYLILKDI